MLEYKFDFTGWRAVTVTCFLVICVVNTLLDAGFALASLIGG